MENISATTLTDRTLHDAGSEPQVNSVDLITHELSHQWFGDLLTCADWSHIWLNEGFATFWADAYLEHRFGQTEYRYSMYQHMQKYLEEDRLRYRRPMVTAYYTDPLDLFDRTTYEKGAVVLDMLRYVIGDDKFFKAISNYAKAHIQGTVVTDDLRKAAEETSGQDLGWFFEEWRSRNFTTRASRRSG
jgi:aminopeptidase N